ncbi:putative type I restriction enzymeP M protein [Eubacterium callanderi]|uniref:type I restriction-modification system subunit M n=1 Tax=Eubacterium callanderi TaxID=53442 RepID=UPI0029FEDAB5|nr:class I SAM-dependent DNA methyltransferase [Eubacterium callanderi]WPK67952.1 putative type I restriction enzymeP M protein [Eubacterium callanderi]WPK72249.1 putative type I restriction enzymeP M protein [Eubacterium callanderi]
MSNRITIDELQTYLWDSAVLLRSSIDAGAYKQYIFPLLFFKRISDVYDEECQKILEQFGDEEALEFEENHRFQVPKGAHWNDVREVSENVGVAIVSAFRKIEKANADKLQGIFGDAAWTNKNRLSDRLLKELIEHFSSRTLSIENCPEDELGQGYEYLIKKFADDSGHTAQEFYTNRTVVHLMTEILRPQSGESIYDPTCGSAGMLISAIAYLQKQKKEWRNVAIYGQEINALTSSIGKMNLFLHGVKDFEIVNGDTLKSPAFIEKGKLKEFDMVLANPPYSISQWDREAFASDKYGRNFLGVPPQGRADYAFLQHILKSLKEDTGRSAILFPHGVLFRNEESSMREKLVRSDMLECVIGLGPNLFYNSPMEACIIICRKNKPANLK